MERRQMLKTLIAGGVQATLAGSVLAQQGAPRPQTTPPRVARNAAEGSGGDQVIITTPEDLEPVLQEWEQKTAIITRLRGSLQRYEYDSVFAIEKRALGEFWYEAPDKGRIDFKPAPLTDPKTGQPLISSKKDAQGNPYKLEAEEEMTWVCDGKSIIQVEHEPKTYGVAEIPPQHQGENIMESPLPFLFGMKADKIKQRYKLSLGSQNGKSGSDGRMKYHVVALPVLQSDARNWQRAEVILDAEFCLPGAIRLIDPGGSKETVYVFPLPGMKAEDTNSSIIRRIWIDNPFKMQLWGYKLVQKEVAPPPGQPQGQGVVPASGAQPAGKATLDFGSGKDN
jgi:TIGR03009 family protein